MAEIRAKLCFGLARAAGMAGMVGGQMLEIAARVRQDALGPNDISLLQRMKTGALIKFSVEAGAILAGANPGVHAALAAYGEASAPRSRSPTTFSTPRARRKP